MKSGITKVVVASAVALAMTATPVLAKKAASMTYINGWASGGGQTELETKGWKWISTNKNSMGYTYSYWWDAKDRDCIVVEVGYGKVLTVNDAKPSDCGHTADGGAGAAVGVVAGAAILGALLSHKSHHQEGKNYDAQNTAEFDRGYKDGLYNGSYHNYSRSDAYSHGYEQGVSERNANLSHHHGYGGYSSAAVYKDLNGARAAGGMDELSRRGFVQVDNFTSGNTRYSIQYRGASRQCIQVTIADGHFYDVRDIGQHPNCR